MTALIAFFAFAGGFVVAGLLASSRRADECQEAYDAGRRDGRLDTLDGTYPGRETTREVA